MIVSKNAFVSRLSIPGLSRVGRQLRSRIVVHSMIGNGSFKAYYAGDMWIAETWDPVAFMFSLNDTSLEEVAAGLLPQDLHSQFDYMQQVFPLAHRLFNCSVRDNARIRYEPEFIAGIAALAKQSNALSVVEFQGGLHIRTDETRVAMLFLGDQHLPLCRDDCVAYCSLGALENLAVKQLLEDVGIELELDE